MAEYIEREAVKALFDERYETAFVQERTRENKEHWRGVCAGLNWGRNTIADAPTADVVPKSEVEASENEIERLKSILNNYALQYGTVTDKQKVIDEAKTEVAREIFAEIEQQLRGLFDFFRQDDCIRESSAIMLAISEIAKLKKKHTEGNQNVNGN